MSIVSLITPDETQLLSGFKQVIEDLLKPLGGFPLAAGEKVLLYGAYLARARALGRESASRAAYGAGGGSL